MAKRKKIDINNIEVVDPVIVNKPCITCGKQFSQDFKSVVERKKLEFEKFNINYYVYKNENNVWAIAESKSFSKIKKENTEYFHISEFKPN